MIQTQQLSDVLSEILTPIIQESVSKIINSTAVPATEIPVEKKQQIIDNVAAVEIFHVTKQTLYNWRRTGSVKYKKIGGKIFYYLEELMKKQAIKPRDRKFNINDFGGHNGN